MRYDDPELAKAYDEARRLPDDVLSLWLDAIARHCGGDDGDGAVDTILDVGCGTGRFADGLAERFGTKVIAIDPSHAMLTQACIATSHLGVEFVLASAEELPADDGSVGLVLMSMVYHHLQDVDRALDECMRVLRPGGLLCIRTSTVETLDGLCYLEWFPSARVVNEKRLPSRDGLAAKVQEHGFTLRARETLTQQHAQTLAEYRERIATRVYSDLAAIPDIEFEAGLAAMADAAEPDGPIEEPIDLFVFARPE